MKVLYVITRADTIAGAQRHVYELSQRLNYDHGETLVVSGVGHAYASLLQSASIEYRQVPEIVRNISIWKDFLAIFKIRKIVKQFDPEIISLHSSKAGLIGRLACLGLKGSVVFTAHGWSFTDGIGKNKQLLFSFVERLLSRITSVIVCVSNFDRRLAIEKGIAEQKLVTIHNGRPEHSYTVATKSEGGVITIVMIGRLDVQKDHMTLFRSLKCLSGYRLILVGDGPKLKELQSLAIDLGIADKVQFVGLLEDVHSILCKSDIFCLISNWEGFPRSTLEAMSHGLPVVVSNVGGAEEAILDGITGFVVEKGNVTSVTARLELLLNDAELRRKMGVQGKKLFKDQFTFQTMYSKTLSVYRDLLDLGSKGG